MYSDEKAVAEPFLWTYHRNCELLLSTRWLRRLLEEGAYRLQLVEPPGGKCRGICLVLPGSCSVGITKEKSPYSSSDQPKRFFQKDSSGGFFEWP